MIKKKEAKPHENQIHIMIVSNHAHIGGRGLATHPHYLDGDATQVQLLPLLFHDFLHIQLEKNRRNYLVNRKSVNGSKV